MQQNKRPYLEWDTECAHNFWLLKLYYPMGHMVSFALNTAKPQFYPHEMEQIRSSISAFTWVGFNSKTYDELMLRLALQGVGVQRLKQANDSLIVGRLRRRDFMEHYPEAKQYIPHFDGIDLFEVVPGVKIGLKTYMARYHAKTIQDLPFDPDAWLTPAEMAVTDHYCGNDLIGTRELREICTDRLALREKLTADIAQDLQDRGITGLHIDLRSKSDAQMSEAMFVARLGYYPSVPEIPTGYQFQITPAPWLQFVTPQMQQVFQTCKDAVFLWSRNDDGESYIGPDGSKIKTGVNMPKVLKDLKIDIAGTIYKFGIGGLHSMEKCQSLWSIPGVQRIFDRDVKSFYPALLLLLDLLPPEIRAIYRDIFDKRLASKPLVDKFKADVKAGISGALEDLKKISTLVDGYKIVMNGSYGKFWSKFSFLCNPNAGVNTTINGQLSLLMLIERLFIGGVIVKSANTDGVVCVVPEGKERYYLDTIAWWEKVTGLETEEVEYKSVHSRDVNNYVAVTMSGEAKRKGRYSKSGVLSGMQGIHPAMDVSRTAAVAYILHRTPVHETVRACTDLTQFIVAKNCSEGAEWQGQYLGKTCRWYYSPSGSEIRGVKKGSKVGGSDGAMPVQTLPATFPTDIDYARYESEAIEMLKDMGVVR